MKRVGVDPTSTTLFPVTFNHFFFLKKKSFKKIHVNLMASHGTSTVQSSNVINLK